VDRRDLFAATAGRRIIAAGGFPIA